METKETTTKTRKPREPKQEVPAAPVSEAPVEQEVPATEEIPATEEVPAGEETRPENPEAGVQASGDAQPETLEPAAEAPTVPDYEGKVLVVIPYLDSASQGRELEFAVAGWRKHFKENFLLVVVGDYHSVCASGDDIFFVPCPRVEAIKGQYLPHIDHANKFKKVIEMFPKAKAFVYSCDDIYAVNDFDLTDVKLLKMEAESFSADENDPNGWWRDMAKTKKVLVSEGLSTHNFVCHLPVYYEVEKLLAIYDEFDCCHNSYVVEQIYFNRYFGSRKPLLLNLNFDNLRCWVGRSNPDWSRLKPMMEKKIWVSNSKAGYQLPLEQALNEHYFGNN